MTRAPAGEPEPAGAFFCPENPRSGESFGRDRPPHSPSLPRSRLEPGRGPVEFAIRCRGAFILLMINGGRELPSLLCRSPVSGERGSLSDLRQRTVWKPDRPKRRSGSRSGMGRDRPEPEATLARPPGFGRRVPALERVEGYPPWREGEKKGGFPKEAAARSE